MILDPSSHNKLRAKDTVSSKQAYDPPPPNIFFIYFKKLCLSIKLCNILIAKK